MPEIFFGTIRSNKAQIILSMYKRFVREWFRCDITPLSHHWDNQWKIHCCRWQKRWTIWRITMNNGLNIPRHCLWNYTQGLYYLSVLLPCHCLVNMHVLFYMQHTGNVELFTLSLSCTPDICLQTDNKVSQAFLCIYTNILIFTMLYFGLFILKASFEILPLQCPVCAVAEEAEQGLSGRVVL